MSSESCTSLKHHYIWKTAVPDRNGVHIHKSEEFSLDGAKWHFKLSSTFGDIRNENEEKWELFMVFPKRRPYPLWNVNVYVEDTASGALESVSSEVKTDLMDICSEKDQYNVRLMTKEEISKMRKHKYKYLSNGTLTFLFAVDEAVKTLQSVRKNNLGANRSEINSLLQLSEDMENAFLKEADADLDILCGDRTFPVIGKILALRSPVLASMLQTGGPYYGKLKVSFDDCDPTTFAEFLKFLYTGKANISCADIAFSLCKIAQKYKVLSLEKECVKFLAENITADVIKQTLKMAEEHVHLELYYAVADFCLEEKWLDSDPYFILAAEEPAITGKLEDIMEEKEKDRTGKDKKEDMMG